MNMQKMTWATFVFLGLFSSVTAFSKPKAVTTDSLSKESLMIELTGQDLNKMSESEFYAEVIQSFRANNEITLQTQSQRFLKKFPRSQFADNVLYLSGMLALQNKNYSSALKSFQKVLKNYPNSNKVVAAQYGKALTYKKLNLAAEARRVFKEVMSKYPGSPESFRAEAELKLLN